MIFLFFLRMFFSRRMAAGISMTLASHVAVIADPGIDRGAFIFDGNCADCHPTEPGLFNKKGPTLFGILGRRSGQVSGFIYSYSLKSSNLLFDAVTLDKYILNPQELIPGTTMRFPGLRSDQERKDLIKFLETLK